MQTNKIVIKLVKQELEFCTVNKIGVTTKDTGMEYMRKVRFLTGVQLKIASATWYKEQLQE